MSVIVKTSGINLNNSIAENITSKLARTTMPIGLISMGIILSHYLNRVVTSLTVTISFLKLLFAPLALLIITGFFYQFNYPNNFLGTFLVSLGPCGAFSLAICEAYNVNPIEKVKSIFVTTVISYFVLTIDDHNVSIVPLTILEVFLRGV